MESQAEVKKLGFLIHSLNQENSKLKKDICSYHSWSTNLVLKQKDQKEIVKSKTEELREITIQNLHSLEEKDRFFQSKNHKSKLIQSDNQLNQFENMSFDYSKEMHRLRKLLEKENKFDNKENVLSTKDKKPSLKRQLQADCTIESGRNKRRKRSKRNYLTAERTVKTSNKKSCSKTRNTNIEDGTVNKEADSHITKNNAGIENYLLTEDNLAQHNISISQRIDPNFTFVTDLHICRLCGLNLNKNSKPKEGNGIMKEAQTAASSEKKELDVPGQVERLVTTVPVQRNNLMKYCTIM